MIPRRRPDEAQLFHDAWQGRGSVDAQVQDLVRTAERLCEAAADVQPSDDFRASLRASLMSEAATVLVPAPTVAPDRFVEVDAAAPHRGRRRLAGLAIAAVTAVGAVGMVSSSANAVPGDALYGVKRSVERVELSLRQSPDSRGTYQLQRAATRLSEIKQLSTASSVDDDTVADLLKDFSEQAESGSTTLFDDYTSHGDQGSIDAVNRFTASAATSLGELSAKMPSDAHDTFQQAATTVSDLVNEVSGLCATCTDVDVSHLVSAVTDLAAKPQHNATKTARPVTASTPRSTPSATTSTKPPTAPTTSLPASTPTPSAKPLTTVVKKATNPVTGLVGAVLGDENQEGLVPSLLNGLLGTKK